MEISRSVSSLHDAADYSTDLWHIRQKQKEQARIVHFVASFVVRLLYVISLILVVNSYVDPMSNLYKNNLSNALSTDGDFGTVSNRCLSFQ